MGFFRKNFSTICLAISTIFLIFTFYKSHIVWDGERNYYYKLSYFIFGSFFLFSILSFFFSEKIKTYSVIIILSIVISFYLFEGYQNYLLISKIKNLEIKKQIQYKKLTGKNYDNRKKIEVYNEIKKVDPSVVVKIHPRNNINNISKNNKKIIPLSGISNAKTLYCNENGYYSMYQSDRYGFNNPDNQWDSKEVKYLLLGDSFVDGACVDRPYDIGSNLRSLSQKTVLNLGQSANGPMMSLAILKEYFRPNVKNIIWVFTEANDIYNLEQEKKSKILNKYLSNKNYKQNLILYQDEIDKISKEIISQSIEDNNKILSDLKLFLTLSKSRIIIRNISKKNYKDNNQVNKLSSFKNIIKEAKEFSEKNNAKFYFVYLPEYSHYAKKYNNEIYLGVKNIIQDLDIPFIDIHKSVFLKQVNPLALFPFEMDGHYNVNGYRKVSENIYNFIK